MPIQPIWFTDDTSDEWKPGYIEARDIAPDSYWLINDRNNRRLRHNKHGIKPRHKSIAMQRPQDFVTVKPQLSGLTPDSELASKPSVPVSPTEQISTGDPPIESLEPLPADPNCKTPPSMRAVTISVKKQAAHATPVQCQQGQSGCQIKSTKNPDYVYI
eukprot:gene18444-20293_t